MSCLDGGLIDPGPSLEFGREPVPDWDGGSIGLSGLKKLERLRFIAGDGGKDAKVSCTLSDKLFLVFSSGSSSTTADEIHPPLSAAGASSYWRDDGRAGW